MTHWVMRPCRGTVRRRFLGIPYKQEVRDARFGAWFIAAGTLAIAHALAKPNDVVLAESEMDSVLVEVLHMPHSPIGTYLSPKELADLPTLLAALQEIWSR